MRAPSLARALVLLGIVTHAPVASALDETSPAEQADQIIVTASRLGATQSTVGSSVSVITQEEIQQGKFTSVAQALRKVPGLDIVQSGPMGGNTAAFIRGADSAQTLVLLDGIELNNPASPNRAFNLANLTLENIERIEIIRGPQSTVYGSDAMGGVINIISKKAKGGVSGTVSSEAGSYNSFTQTGGVSYGSDVVDFTGGVTRQDLGNISAASARYGNSEHDGYENTSLSGRLRVSPNDKLDAILTTRYSNSGAALDNFGGAGGDDPNRRFDNEEFFSRAEVSSYHLGEELTPTAWFAYSHHGLTDKNDPDVNSSELLRSSYTGGLSDVGTKLTWKPREYFSAVIGGESQAETAQSKYLSDGAYGPYEDNLSERSATTNSAFLETKTSYNKDAFVDVGVRYDHHSIFGSRTTFRAAPAWHVTSSTKLRGSVGTGFKAPSLVQLYSSYGNKDLSAETNVGWDVGVDQEIVAKTLTSSLTFFRNDYDNLITFNPSTFVLENINKAYTQGVEAALTYTVSEVASIRGAYTYTEAVDKDTDERLLRRPINKGSMTFVYTPTSRVTSQIQWRMYGNRKDVDYSSGSPSTTTLAGYGLVDIATTYKLSERFDLFARVDNLFDQEYEEVLGYGTLGAAAYGGVKVTL